MKEIVEVMARGMAEGESVPPGITLDWQGYLEEARDALSALDAAGYAVVPKEPTPGMYVKGDERIIEFLNGTAFVNNESTPATECYRAMLTASKEPPHE